jgi:hypothetical protein
MEEHIWITMYICGCLDDVLCVVVRIGSVDNNHQKGCNNQ